MFHTGDSIIWTFKNTTGSGCINSKQTDFWKVKSSDGIYYLPIKDTVFEHDNTLCNSCKKKEADCDNELTVCCYGEDTVEGQYLCSDCGFDEDHNLCNDCNRFVFCEDTICVMINKGSEICELCHECYEQADDVIYNEETGEYTSN